MCFPEQRRLAGVQGWAIAFIRRKHVLAAVPPVLCACCVRQRHLVFDLAVLTAEHNIQIHNNNIVSSSVLQTL